MGFASKMIKSIQNEHLSERKTLDIGYIIRGQAASEGFEPSIYPETNWLFVPSNCEADVALRCASKAPTFLAHRFLLPYQVGLSPPSKTKRSKNLALSLLLDRLAVCIRLVDSRTVSVLNHMLCLTSSPVTRKEARAESLTFHVLILTR